MPLITNGSDKNSGVTALKSSFQIQSSEIMFVLPRINLDKPMR
jgi:hypothetical protein